MNLGHLKDKFKADEIEWRIARAGVKKDGEIWAKCLAYVTSRAVMDRLDSAVGPASWKVSYRFEDEKANSTGGVIATISIKCGDEWVSKEDGAGQTDVEAFKGGLSSAIKRAAVVWGIGRYLYDLEGGWATIVERGTKGAYHQPKPKNGETPDFFWMPPQLPDWALPPKPAPTGITATAPQSMQIPRRTSNFGTAAAPVTKPN